MLEQNTNRTYWFIGSTLVIASLVALCSVAFPELFDLVTSRFQRMVPKL